MVNLAVQMFSALKKNIEKIEKSLAYTFQNKELLIQAFVDSSFPMPVMVNENGETNEDFVWRGNYLLQLVIADSIESNHHTVDKATKNTMLNKHTSSDACVKYMDKLKVFDFYLYAMPHGFGISAEDKTKSFKGKCFKALLTAMYLDSGKDFSKISTLFIDYFSEEFEDSLSLSEKNWKSLLNEWTQKERLPQPLFSVLDRKGKDHAPIFTVEVVVDGEKLGSAESSSKKEAEQQCAKKAYEKLVKD